MAGKNTFKTVINNAIEGFNSIQKTLSTFSDLGVSDVSTNNKTVTGSITPSEMASFINNMATVKLSNGSFRSGKIEVFEGGTISGGGNTGGGSYTIPVVSQLPSISESNVGDVVIYNNDIYVLMEE